MRVSTAASLIDVFAKNGLHLEGEVGKTFKIVVSISALKSLPKRARKKKPRLVTR